MALSLPNDFVNGEIADAVPVEQNYNLIQDYVNNEVINRDGSVSMNAPLLLQGDPSQANHAANKDYVDSVLPIGIMMPWPAPSAPAGAWRLCNGATLAISSYPELFAVIGGRYGTATAGNFLLPNMVGRIIIGLDPTDDVHHFNNLAHTGGSWVVPVPQHLHAMAHSHTMAHTHEMPHVHSIAHNHAPVTTATDGDHDHDAGYFGYNVAAGATMLDRGVGVPGSTALNGTLIAGDHNHTVDLPNFTGNSGQPDDATTEASSATSTGGTSTPNTSMNGTAGAEFHPPFIVLNYIIRVI